MKIIVVGATGTIGKSVVKALSGRHEILKVSHSGGDVQVNLAVPDCILELQRGIRINAVSPIYVSETLKAMGRDSAAGMPAVETTIACVEGVERQYNGEVLDVRQVG
ncbi:MAG: hypothetical protein NWR42_00230 [Desulfobacterales bacterium]|nr:hypothetical protein [Desulfobacterales bacterium]